MNEKVEKVEVLRPEVQGSEDRGGSPFEGGDLLCDDNVPREALESYVIIMRCHEAWRHHIIIRLRRSYGARCSDS